MSKLESTYQAKLKDKIEEKFEGAIVLKNDPHFKQGIPDLSIFYKDKWATLETKRSKDASRRPNQDYYVELMNKMSFSRVIFPENEEEVLNELQQAFGL